MGNVNYKQANTAIVNEMIRITRFCFFLSADMVTISNKN